MTALFNFRRTLDRVDNLINLNKRLSNRGRPPRENSDILRAAVVLSLGALDALVADAIVEAVAKASKQGKLGGRVAGWLGKDGQQSLSILAHEQPHSAMAEFVADKLSGITLQRTAMIEDNLSAILGVDLDWAAAAKRVGDSTTADDLQERLNCLSDRRNQIAHKGDIKAGTTRPETIKRAWVERHIKDVRDTGEEICKCIRRAYH